MLTPTQSSVFEYILQYRSEQGYSPTYGEIQKHFGWLSANASFEHVKALARHGYVKLGPRKMARAITPVENPPQAFPICKDPSDTDWDAVCRDAERYRWIRGYYREGISPEDLDVYVDSRRGVQHETTTPEPCAGAVHAAGDQHPDLGSDTRIDQASERSLEALIEFNKALMEDQE